MAFRGDVLSEEDSKIILGAAQRGMGDLEPETARAVLAAMEENPRRDAAIARLRANPESAIYLDGGLLFRGTLPGKEAR